MKMKREPFYYQNLSRLKDESFDDFEYIIGLDVKRTPEAMKSAEFAAIMNRILLSYAK